MVAELYGKQTGTAHGRGGSVHLSAPEVGFIAASAILGQTMAVATGSAWAFKMDGSRRIAVCFFGDGAIEEGIFHETLNFASLKHLPVVFVCENNGYSTHTLLEVRQPKGITIWERARSYHMPSRFADGNDVFAVRQAAEEAVAWARSGKGRTSWSSPRTAGENMLGPTGTTRPAIERGLRSMPGSSAARSRRRPPAGLEAGVSTADDIERWQQELQREIDAAVESAQSGSISVVEHLMDGTY